MRVGSKEEEQIWMSFVLTEYFRQILRIIELFELEETFKGHLVWLPCTELYGLEGTSGDWVQPPC